MDINYCLSFFQINLCGIELFVEVFFACRFKWCYILLELTIQQQLNETEIILLQ